MVKQQLVGHTAGTPCQFLVDHARAVHPECPVSCRQFNVFTTTCAPGELPYHSRRDDVLVPIADYTDRAFAAVLAFYRLDKEKDTSKAVKLARGQVMNLQGYDWKKLVTVMEGIDPERTDPIS